MHHITIEHGAFWMDVTRIHAAVLWVGMKVRKVSDFLKFKSKHNNGGKHFDDDQQNDEYWIPPNM